MNKCKNQHLAVIFHLLHDHCYGQATTMVTYVLHHLVQTVMFLLLKLHFLMSTQKCKKLEFGNLHFGWSFYYYLFLVLLDRGHIHY